MVGTENLYSHTRKPWRNVHELCKFSGAVLVLLQMRHLRTAVRFRSRQIYDIHMTNFQLSDIKTDASFFDGYYSDLLSGFA